MNGLREMQSIVDVMMERDDMSEFEANKMVEDARLLVQQGADPEAVLQDCFGLEPDYIFDLI